MTSKHTKIEGVKVFARISAESDWVHVETIPDHEQAVEFCESLEDNPKNREEYISEPLS